MSAITLQEHYARELSLQAPSLVQAPWRYVRAPDHEQNHARELLK